MVSKQRQKEWNEKLENIVEIVTDLRNNYTDVRNHCKNCYIENTCMRKCDEYPLCPFKAEDDGCYLCYICERIEGA